MWSTIQRTSLQPVDHSRFVGRPPGKLGWVGNSWQPDRRHHHAVGVGRTKRSTRYINIRTISLLHRVAQKKSKPQSFVHRQNLCKILTDFQIFFFTAAVFCGKFVVKWLLNIPSHHTLTKSLHYLVKYKMCKIHQYLVKMWRRVWSLILWPILNVKLCFVVDRLSV